VHLLTHLAAVGASCNMPLQLVHPIIRKLSISRRHNPFLCKIAIHGYVLPASKNVSKTTFQLSARRAEPGSFASPGKT
jgi:hypothetical protein